MFPLIFKLLGLKTPSKQLDRSFVKKLRAAVVHNKAATPATAEKQL
jgi:hypothetical protein